MKAKNWIYYLAFGSLRVAGQDILFDFDSAPVHSPLPLSLTAGGVTAQFSATGQGYSIQPVNTMGFTPAGFAGLCLYPSSVFASDLAVTFSRSLTNFSILYSPQELGCDDSATMKVTAYMDGSAVGSATKTASAPGTWPSDTLSFGSDQPFNSVLVHYAAKPPTCQDWGPIFLADNMIISPGPLPPSLQATLSGSDITITWPASATGFLLQSCTNLANLVAWTPVTNPPAITAGNWAVTLTAAAPKSFFRLSRP